MRVFVFDAGAIEIPIALGERSVNGISLRSAGASEPSAEATSVYHRSQLGDCSNLSGVLPGKRTARIVAQARQVAASGEKNGRTTG